MNYKIIIVLVLFSTNISFSQGKYDRLLESGKYKKALKKIDRKLSKDSLAIDVLYSKVQLYNARDFKEFDSELSYELVNDLERRYNYLSYEDQHGYGEDGITEKSIELLRKNVISKAYEDVTSYNDIEHYEYFMSFYALMSAQVKRDIQGRIYGLAFEEVKKQNKVKKYNDFIYKYPDAPQIRKVKLMRNECAFDNAKKENSIVAFRDFIEHYPNAIQSKKAKQFIYKLAFNEILDSEDYQSFLQYYKRYPNSPYRSAAHDKYEYLLYKEITQSGTLDSYLSFIERYPENNYRSEAIQMAINTGAESNDFVQLLETVKMLGDFGSMNKIVQKMYDIISLEGRRYDLERFHIEYGQYIDDIRYQKDLQLSLQFENLNFKDGSLENYGVINQFIIDAAPKNIALIALISSLRSSIDAENWKEASRVFKKHKTRFKGNKNYSKTLDLLMDNLIDDFVKYPIDEKINSLEGNEYVPVITADGSTIYFCGKGRSDNLGGEDIFVSYLRGLEWSVPELVADLSSSSQNEAPESLTADGTRMNLFISGQIYESSMTLNGWSEPVLMDESINRGEWNADASYTGDGKAVLFTSKREGGYDYGKEYRQGVNAASDIYVSVINPNGELEEPINLGPTINTMYSERTPFLHPDMKTLYFSSDGHGGLGGLDVFISKKLKEDSWTEWSEPINIGKYFNTSGSNWGYKITTDGKRAYFSEQKSSSENNQDLFWIKLPPRLRPELVATVKGTLKDLNEQAVSANIVIQDLKTGKEVAKANTNPSNGEFYVVLPLGKIYGYHVDKKELYPIAGNIDLRDVDKAVEKLDSIKVISYDELIENKLSVPINNLFFDFGESKLLQESKPELVRVAEIIKENNFNIVIEGHTDNVGSEEFNYELSLKRANAVRSFLIKQGCSPDQLNPVGLGRDKPKMSNDTEDGRSINRRVELRFTR